jgi:hypothetical protein
MHLLTLREIIRDPDKAYAIGPVVRQHLPSFEDTAAAWASLGVPRAKGVARIAMITASVSLPEN